jgi:hypothetical protein
VNISGCACERIDGIAAVSGSQHVWFTARASRVTSRRSAFLCGQEL